MLVDMERHVEHVVNFHSVSKVDCEHLVYQPLAGYACVLQTERHDLVTKDVPLGDECDILLIVWVYEDLIIA